MRSGFITLYIDTSSSKFYAGIVKDETLLIEIQEALAKNLSTYAVSKIADMFEKVNLKPNDVDKIIVVNGPGSFTGIRVGISIAKTMAWALKKEITAITSLEAMAVSTTIKDYKVPIIDARRGYVFAGIYNNNNEQILKNQYIRIETLVTAADSLNAPYQIICNDSLDIDKIEYRPNIEKIVSTFKEKQSLHPHAVNPDYLKKTEAEEKQGI